MLNNEFRLIGTVISDFEKVENVNFPKYEFSIEVEKKNKKGTMSVRVTVFEKNNSIDVNASLRGKQIILQGYIDSYKDYVKLIAQDVVVIGAVPEPEKKIEGANLEPLDLPDDDLPF